MTNTTADVLRIVNLICYTLCLVCIIGGVISGLGMIWGGGSTVEGWKYLLTFVVLFLGSSLTLSVNRVMMKR